MAEAKSEPKCEISNATDSRRIFMGFGRETEMDYEDASEPTTASDSQRPIVLGFTREKEMDYEDWDSRKIVQLILHRRNTVERQ